MIRNVPLTNSAVVYTAKNSCEIKVGKTVYSIKHKWEKADISDLISNYIADNILRTDTANAA